MNNHKFGGEGSQIIWICLGGLSGRVPCDEVHAVTKDSSISFSVQHLNSSNILAHNPKSMYHPSCPVNIMDFYIDFYFCLVILDLYFGLFLAQKIYL